MPHVKVESDAEWGISKICPVKI